MGKARKAIQWLSFAFVADKAGVFPYSCQLHAAHIGGSLIVEPKKGPMQPL